jgi:hypothetical protein
MKTGCACPEQYPDWDGRDIDLGGHCVHVLGIPSLLHMPVGYEAYLKRQYDELQALHLAETWPNLVLTRTGMFRGAIMRLLERTRSPSRRVTYLPRPFRVRGKLHLGDVGTMRGSVREVQMALLDSGRMPKELYICYLTCPLCRDTRGGNKILLLRRWTESPLLKNRVSKARANRS